MDDLGGDPRPRGRQPHGHFGREAQLVQALDPGQRSGLAATFDQLLTDVAARIAASG